MQPQNLDVNRGTTYTIGVEYDRAGGTLDGATIRFTVKSVEFDSDADDSGAILTRDVTDHLDARTSAIALAPADTQELEPGDFYYDIKVQEAAAGGTYLIAKGRFRLDGSPTNRVA